MTKLLITLTMLISLPAYAGGAIQFPINTTSTASVLLNLETHRACNDHYVNGAYTTGWEACTAFEAAQTARMIARKAASDAAAAAARAANITARDVQAQARLLSPP